MMQQRRSCLTWDRNVVDRVGDGAARHASICIHWNPCSGLPPILIEAPLHYFGTQALVGLLALIVLTVFEGVR
jgi:hypothetical protein